MPLVKSKLYRAFKYTVYVALLVNVGYFFLEGLGGAGYIYRDGMALDEVIIAFSTAIDTAAWLVLLLIFEAETSWLDDNPSPGVRGMLTAGTVICYLLIVYSFYGYIGVQAVPAGFAPYQGVDPCTLTGTMASYALELDQYVPLDSENCRTLAGGAMYNASLDMFATLKVQSEMARLTFLDVLNAGTWIIVVTVLALEIRIVDFARLGALGLRVINLVKLGLYAILLYAAIEWGRLGAPWDTWDAFLWLAAFFFIELNIFSDQGAKQRSAPDATSSA